MSATPDAGVPCRIVVCRDCCCGSPKITGVDHAAQTERLREAAPVRVVQPAAAGRAAGGRPVWLGLVNDSAATEDVVSWVREGGPGVAPLPDILGLYVFTPAARRRSDGS